MCFLMSAFFGFFSWMELIILFLLVIGIVVLAAVVGLIIYLVTRKPKK